MENWIEKALEIGFDEAVSLDISTLRPRADVRAMCAAANAALTAATGPVRPTAARWKTALPSLAAIPGASCCRPLKNWRKPLTPRGTAGRSSGICGSFTPSRRKSEERIPTPCVWVPVAAGSARNAPFPNHAGSRRRRTPLWKATGCSSLRSAGITIFRTITGSAPLHTLPVYCFDDYLSVKMYQNP